LLKKIVYTISLLLISGFLVFKMADEPLPEGTEGPRAELLADKMLDALNYEAWKEVGAVGWSYPRGHHYLWDKEANLVEVKWDDYTVLLNPETQTGKAFADGKVIEENSEEIIKTAFEHFANDSFWLIAPFKVRDPGTVRKVVKINDKDALLVQYTTGGVTPGDSYLWILDDYGVPMAWRFWVKIVPLGGMEFTWENWQTIEGAEIATFHDGLLDIEITNLRSAEKIEHLNNGKDPFEIIR